MRFDRQIFFEQYRRHFGAIKRPYVVTGLERLLGGFEAYHGWWDDLQQIANAFAQVGIETAWSFTPVVEGYYLGDPDKPNYFSGNTDYVKRFQAGLRYFPHHGRGDIQLTWQTNYADQDARIRKWFPERVADFEKRTGRRFDLANDPEQALDPWISFCVFTIGMHLGTFRSGHNLDRYITPTKCDHFNARDIVNGDKNYLKKGSNKRIGTVCKETAEKFEVILKASLLSGEPIFELPEIDSLVENIGPEPSLPGNPPNSVALPDTEPDGNGQPDSVAVTADQTAPAGGQPARHWLSVEDWKPLVLRWLKRIWGITIPGNLTQAAGFVSAAAADVSNWYLYSAIAVVIFVLTSIAAVVVSGVLLCVWYFNRKEIEQAKLLEARALIDPSLGNLGVIIEKK